jgi:hypothetical protein
VALKPVALAKELQKFGGAKGLQVVIFMKVLFVVFVLFVSQIDFSSHSLGKFR